MPMSSSSKPKDYRVASIVLIGLTAAFVTPTLRAGQQAPSRAVTFTKHIAPMLQRSCENCHRTNGVAPMPLTTYDEARPWARAIKRKTGSREMPPWFIEKGIGIQQFKDDPSLSDAEIEDIAAWVDSGAPRGNPADMPPPRRYADAGGWSIGTPDLIVSSPVMTVNARAADWHGEVGPTPTGLMEDRYVQAVEFKEVRVEGGPISGSQGRRAISATSAFITRDCTKSIRTVSSGRRPMASAAGSISCTSWATTRRSTPPKRACC